MQAGSGAAQRSARAKLAYLMSLMRPHYGRRTLRQ